MTEEHFFIVSLTIQIFNNVKGKLFIFKIENDYKEIGNIKNSNTLLDTKDNKDIFTDRGTNLNISTTIRKKPSQNLFQFVVAPESGKISAGLFKNSELTYKEKFAEKALKQAGFSTKLREEENNDVVIEKFRLKTEFLAKKKVRLVKLRDDKLIQYDDDQNESKEFQIDNIPSNGLNFNKEESEDLNTKEINPHNRKKLLRGKSYLQKWLSRSAPPRLYSIFIIVGTSLLFLALFLDFIQILYKRKHLTDTYNLYKEYQLNGSGLLHFDGIVICLELLSLDYDRMQTQKQDLDPTLQNFIEKINELKNAKLELYEEAGSNSLEVKYSGKETRKSSMAGLIDQMISRILDLTKNFEKNENKQKFDIKKPEFRFLIENSFGVLTTSMSQILDHIETKIRSKSQEIYQFAFIIFGIAFVLNIFAILGFFYGFVQLKKFSKKSLSVFLKLPHQKIKDRFSLCESYVLDLKNPEKPNLTRLELKDALSTPSNFLEEESTSLVSEDFFFGMKKKKFKEEKFFRIRDLMMSGVSLVIVQFYFLIILIAATRSSNLEEHTIPYFISNTNKLIGYGSELMAAIGYHLDPNLQFSGKVVDVYAKKRVPEIFGYMRDVNEVEYFLIRL